LLLEDTTPLGAFELALDRPHTVPEALYWLFRSFLVGDQSRLEPLLAKTLGSRSKWIRDTADLLRQAVSGARVPIGHIDDISALAASFRRQCRAERLVRGWGS